MTIRGYADVSGVINSLGIKKTTVTFSGVQPGHELWLVFGAAVTGTGPVLVGQAAEGMVAGFQLRNFNRRPSTDVGKPYEYTIDGAITPWCSAVFS